MPTASVNFTHLQAIPDPRRREPLHKLVDILVISLCGFIAGCESWVDVELFGKAKRPWFETLLELPNGIPSHDTFGRVFALLDSKDLVVILRRFVQALLPSLKGTAVAIDGKTVANSADPMNGKDALHLVSAWASEHGVVLGQVATAEDSNEIPAIPQLLRLLNLKGAVVTIDAIGCQREIAGQIRDQAADYVLAVKGNQETLHQTVTSKFEEYLEADQLPAEVKQHTARDKNHGRTETRTYYAAPVPKAVRAKWRDAQSMVMVCRETTQQGETTGEVRYFLSSLPVKVKHLAKLIRGHWKIENQLHWSLDVTFTEDKSRMRQGYAAENAALLRRLSLSILKQDTRYSDSLRCKRLRAGWQKEALSHFLAIFSEN